MSTLEYDDIRDVAVRYDNGRYRIFGRATDCFVNSGKTYPMYDIEEQVLTHPITAKRDYLSLSNETTDYYSFDKNTNTIYCANIGEDKVEVSDGDVAIIKVD